jgi:hypothetical protein
MRQALGAREARCSTKDRKHLAHMKNYESKEKVHEPRHHAVITAMRQALGARETRCSTKACKRLAHMKNDKL